MSLVSISSSSLHFHHTFHTKPILTPPQNLKPMISTSLKISCKHSQNDQNDPSTSRKVENKVGKLAVVTVASGVLILGSVVGDAFAAKYGGQSQPFRSLAPHSSSPRINSRNNIYANQRVAPPLVGGYGIGLGVPFYNGGSPFTFFAPGPSAATGIGGGFDLLVLFLIFGVVAAIFGGFPGSRIHNDDYYY